MFVPSREEVQEIRAHWGWLVEATMQPWMISASGDVFFEASDASIHWLDTGQGTLTGIARDRDAFMHQCKKDGGAEYLLAPVIDALFAAGVTLEPGQCFGYKTLPILGGTYTVDNMYATPAAALLGFSGHVHRQIKDLPDGSRISFAMEGQ